MPLPSHPALQEQANDPERLVQVALEWHLSPVSHSSTSTQFVTSPSSALYPFTHAQTPSTHTEFDGQELGHASARNQNVFTGIISNADCMSVTILKRSQKSHYSLEKSHDIQILDTLFELLAPRFSLGQSRFHQDWTKEKFMIFMIITLEELSGSDQN